MSALTDPGNVLFEEIVDQGFTEEEAYELLTEEAGEVLEPIVSSANPKAHTGAMIALVPSEADVARLAVETGEAPEELHLTLLYLGEADQISEDMRQKMMLAGQEYFTDAILSESFGVDIFNPHNPDVETALVLGIKGEDMVSPRLNLVSAIRGMYDYPPNHEPWIPHVTLKYTDDIPEALDFVEKLGPVTFDRLRFAFGGEVFDFPLSAPDELDEPITAAATKLPRQLLRYWLSPEGSARVGGWGNEGSFTKCTIEMRKEGVPKRMINGLCANLYQRATGHSPGRKKEENAMEPLTAAGFTVTELDEMFEPEEIVEEMPSYAAWEGVLTVEGHESGDGRMFQFGSLDWDTPPIPLMYQPANIGGHNGSVLVGQITRVMRKNDQIYGAGIIDLKAVHNGFEIGKEVYRLMSEEFLNGVSVDVDRVKNADVEMHFDADAGPMDKPRLTVFKRGRIRGATLVAFPAFTEAAIYLTGEVMTASAAGIDENCGCTAPADGPLVAAGHTIEIPDLPKAEWFNEPTDVQLSGALTVTDQGRIYGLLAPAGTTHRAVKTKVPTKNVDYSRFHKAETIVEGGSRVVTGVVTMNCGHASTVNYGTLDNRIEHYDNSCSVVANVRVGEREDGSVWVAGALTPFATAEQVTKMMACTLSGDWQPHPDRKGIREFIAALLVPVPGFAMAREMASVTLEDGALVASSVPVQWAVADEVVEQEDIETYTAPEGHDEAALVASANATKLALAEMLGMDPASRKIKLAEELGR